MSRPPKTLRMHQVTSFKHVVLPNRCSSVTSETSHLWFHARVVRRSTQTNHLGGSRSAGKTHSYDGLGDGGNMVPYFQEATGSNGVHESPSVTHLRAESVHCSTFLCNTFIVHERQMSNAPDTDCSRFGTCFTENTTHIFQYPIE
mmetsp:Transcript_8021/g.11706  ORF Transcript_8021/g.11706 Transcript_8021/m.11706 type:complete len:145 (-) Transcript_8021:59-493(-)